MYFTSFDIVVLGTVWRLDRLLILDVVVLGGDIDPLLVLVGHDVGVESEDGVHHGADSTERHGPGLPGLLYQGPLHVLDGLAPICLPLVFPNRVSV